MRLLAISHSAILDVNRPLFYQLAQRGHRVLLVVPSRWKNDYGTGYLAPVPLATGARDRVALRSLAVRRFRQTSIHVYTAPALVHLARWRPDVVFIDEEPWSVAATQWLAVARLARAPVIVHTEENRERRFPAPLAALRRLVLARSDHIFTTSEDARALIANEGFDTSASVFPHAVDPDLFFPGAPRARLRDRFHIGFAGRIVPAKGIETLLHALAILHAPPRDAVPPILDIFGSGAEEYVARLRQRQADLGLTAEQVVWHGPLAHDAVPEAMRALDLLVVPTIDYQGYKEQFGRVVIEALACRVPVLTSDNGELPLLMRATGGGMVFRQGDAGDLAARIAEAVAAPAQLDAMAERGYQHVRAHYSYEALARQFEQVASRLVACAS